MPFANLVGNAVVVSRLARMASTAKVPPSLLFVGRPGVGKLRAAVTLAQALNCRALPDDACGECAPCLRIERGEHPDVRVIRPEGKGGQVRVDVVRDAVSQISFRPFEGRRRIVILADAERMNPSTANTLLKTLEEPPSWATLVLITANEGAMLETILSRCQVLRFSPLAPEELATLLVERHGVPPEHAALLAAVSGGGLTRALELGEEPLAELRAEALKIARVAAVGAPERDLVPWAGALAKEGRLLLLLDLVLAVLRDVSAKLSGAPLVHRDLEPEIAELAEKRPLDVWLSSYALAEGALVDLRDRYLNKRITMSRLLLSFHELSELVTGPDSSSPHDVYSSTRNR